MPLVGVIVGSKSDLPDLEATSQVLDQYGIEHEVVVASAHRTPERVAEFAQTARDRGIEVIIAAAGGAAALPGAVAALTTLPVIGIPLTSSELNGIDSLYSIAQMPPGIPVACVAVGGWGARNAAHLAAEILAIKHESVREACEAYRESLRSG